MTENIIRDALYRRPAATTILMIGLAAAVFFAVHSTMAPVFNLRSDLTYVGIVLTVIMALLFGWFVPSTTTWGRISKIVLILLCLWLGVAAWIVWSGAPLPGVVYWISLRLATVALLPVCGLLLVIGRVQGESAWFGIAETLIGLLLAVLGSVRP